MTDSRWRSTSADASESAANDAAEQHGAQDEHGERRPGRPSNRAPRRNASPPMINDWRTRLTAS